MNRAQCDALLDYIDDRIDRGETHPHTIESRTHFRELCEPVQSELCPVSVDWEASFKSLKLRHDRLCHLARQVSSSPAIGPSVEALRAYLLEG